MTTPRLTDAELADGCRPCACGRAPKLVETGYAYVRGVTINMVSVEGWQAGHLARSIAEHEATHQDPK